MICSFKGSPSARVSNMLPKCDGQISKILSKDVPANMPDGMTLDGVGVCNSAAGMATPSTPLKPSKSTRFWRAITKSLETALEDSPSVAAGSKANRTSF